MTIDLVAFQPADLEDAVDYLYNNSEPDDIEFIRTNDWCIMHHGFGTALRNNWGLWTGSALQTFFKTKYGLGHADDMSGMILKWLSCRVRDEIFDDQAEAKHYRDFWINQQIDPLTQE